MGDTTISGITGGTNTMSEEDVSVISQRFLSMITVLSSKRNHKSLEGLPSAPPFVGPVEEIKQEKTDHTSLTVYSNEERNTRMDSREIVKYETSKPSNRNVCGGSVPSSPARSPTFYASSLGAWPSMIAFDGCSRICLNAWAKGCMEGIIFLENDCSLLRTTFGLQEALLKSKDELFLSQPKKTVGKMKVQVRKVIMRKDQQTGCCFSSIKPPKVKLETISCFSSIKPPKVKLETIKRHFSTVQSKISSRWQAVKRNLLKNGVSSLSSTSSSNEVIKETYSCLLRLKSSDEIYMVRTQPGSTETHTFLPDSLGDDLILEVHDSYGKYYGRAMVEVATISEDSNGKLRWCPIYREQDHELIGKIQLYIDYTTSFDDSLKGGVVANTVAYDIVMEVAMKVENFQQRNLVLQGPWKWLLSEFATNYDVSDAYTKLRYLSYVMDVATPTADCVSIVYDLLLPVKMKSDLNDQEKEILGEINKKIEQTLVLVFENYKSLDEESLLGIMDVFTPATGVAAPVLDPALKLYQLLHDILSPETQSKLCSYFQAAAKKRSRRHLAETDDYVNGNGNGVLMDSVAVSTAYQKIKSLCLNIKNEIFTDIQIQNSNVLPSFIDLPKLSTAIYSEELANRLRAFLVACPPTGPSHVTDLLIATSDFQNDLTLWNINPVENRFDAKELFHSYIMIWIQDKKLSLLEICKMNQARGSQGRPQDLTTPFVDELYNCLNETLDDYEVIISRWPEYRFALGNAITGIEMAIIKSLDKQYAKVLSPLEEYMTPQKFGLKYVQKLSKRTKSPYEVPRELAVLLNSMKRMIDVLHPIMEQKLKSWGSCCIPDGGQEALDECLSQVTAMFKSKFRNYIRAVVEKLLENTRLHNNTKLKKILQDSKESLGESEIKCRMQPITEQLKETMNKLHSIFETHVFIATCRRYWDQMGKDVLSFLENRKENHSWYKGSRVADSILNNAFASQMQQLLGNTLQEEDLKPPPSIVELRSIIGCC